MTISGTNFGNDSSSCFVVLGANYYSTQSRAWLYEKIYVPTLLPFSPTLVNFAAPFSAGDVDIFVRGRGPCVCGS